MAPDACPFVSGDLVTRSTYRVLALSLACAQTFDDFGIKVRLSSKIHRGGLTRRGWVSI